MQAGQHYVQMRSPLATFVTDVRRRRIVTSQEDQPLPCTRRQLLQELELRTKREDVLVQELKTRMMKEETLVQELSSRKNREGMLWRRLEALRQREVDFLRDQDFRKKIEKELLQECCKLQKERDEWSNLCTSALASMKGLEAEIESRNKKFAEMERKLNLCHAPEESRAGKKAQDEVLFSQKNDLIVALQFHIAELEKQKQLHSDNMAEKDEVLRDVICTVNSMQVKLYKHVATLTTNVQEFKRIIENPVETNLPVCNPWNNIEDDPEVEETTFSDKHAENLGWPSLELSARNLMKEIEYAQSIMALVAKQAVQKRCEVPFRLEPTSDADLNSCKLCRCVRI